MGNALFLCNLIMAFGGRNRPIYAVIRTRTLVSVGVYSRAETLPLPTADVLALGAAKQCHPGLEEGVTTIYSLTRVVLVFYGTRYIDD